MSDERFSTLLPPPLAELHRRGILTAAPFGDAPITFREGRSGDRKHFSRRRGKKNERLRSGLAPRCVLSRFRNSLTSYEEWEGIHR